MPALIATARHGGSVVEVNLRVGGYIWENSPAINVYGTVVDAEKLQRGLIVAEERTLTQDPAFAIRAIVDIAIRALSPAVNDPTTASQALDVLEPLLHRLAQGTWAPATSTTPTERSGSSTTLRTGRT